MTEGDSPDPWRPSEAAALRHPAIERAARWLDPNPALTGAALDVARVFASATVDLLVAVPEDSPELTAALGHLLVAKDAAVRASLAARS